MIKKKAQNTLSLAHVDAANVNEIIESLDRIYQRRFLIKLW